MYEQKTQSNGDKSQKKDYFNFYRFGYSVNFTCSTKNY